MTVVDHQKGGRFKWDASKVTLYLSERQRAIDGFIKGDKLLEELKDKSPFNANLLDYLLKHPHLIPEEWKNEWVLFFGTTYCDYASGGRRLYVRHLCWLINKWGWGYLWLDLDLDGHRPAAVLAS